MREYLTACKYSDYSRHKETPPSISIGIYAAQRIFYSTFRQDTGFSADFADEAEVVYPCPSDTVERLLLLQQATGKFVMTFHKPFLKFPEVMPVLMDKADEIEDFPEVYQGYHGKNDKGRGSEQRPSGLQVDLKHSS